MEDSIPDEEVIRDFEEKIVKPLRLKKEEIKIVEIGEFGTIALTPEEILEHMKLKTPIGVRHIQVHRNWLKYIRSKKGGKP